MPSDSGQCERPHISSPLQKIHKVGLGLILHVTASEMLIATLSTALWLTDERFPNSRKRVILSATSLKSWEHMQ